MRKKPCAQIGTLAETANMHKWVCVASKQIFDMVENMVGKKRHHLPVRIWMAGQHGCVRDSHADILCCIFAFVQCFLVCCFILYLVVVPKKWKKRVC